MGFVETILPLVLVGIIVVVSALIYKYATSRISGKQTLLNEVWVFLGRDPNELSIVERQFSAVDLPNLQLAIEGYADRYKAVRRVVGYSSENGAFNNDLRSLLRESYRATALGPVVYTEVDVDVDRQLACVENGLHFIETPQGKFVVHVRREMFQNSLQLEVLSDSPEFAARFLEDIRREIDEKNVFRGKIITLECQAESCEESQNAIIRFHDFPEITRDEIILPEETLDLIERNTVRFYRQADTLRKANRSIKRGLLLYGKPGTGKTYTAKWLAQSLQGVTVILVSGEQLWMIKQCCQMARLLAPALVIMEDVDLIASQRDGRRHPIFQSTLHQLLNEMDGLTSDAAVMFLLTTNRVEELEQALAARPGRIDQIVEYPLPDADCRRRLLELYGQGMCLDLKDPDQLIIKTKGASPAFIQELLRKSAFLAAEDNSHNNGQLHVKDCHVESSLHEMVIGGGSLMKQLLGFEEVNHE